MRSYSFSLEKVLNIRETREKQIAEDMGKIQMKLNVQKEALRALEEDLDSSDGNFSSVLDLQYKDLYRTKVREDIYVKNEVIDSINLDLESTRRELVEAQKDRKVMERLKEKDRENYYNKIKCEEQKQLDELAVLKYNYRSLM